MLFTKKKKKKNFLKHLEIKSKITGKYTMQILSKLNLDDCANIGDLASWSISVIKRDILC